MPNEYPEPTWTVTQDVTGDPSRFCVTRITPFQLTGIFIRLMQYHFSSPGNIVNPAIKSLVWTPNSSCNPVLETRGGEEYEIPPTRIWVDSEYSEDQAGMNRRPAVLVKRESVMSKAMSLRSEVLPGRDPRTNTVRGKQMLREIQGKHSLICAGNTGAEADVLAQEVFERMMLYAPVIRSDFNLGLLNVSGFGEVARQADAGGGKGAYYSVVGISWGYEHSWQIIQISPQLRRVLLGYG